MKKNPFLLSALALSLLLSACSQSDLLNSQMEEGTNAIELSASVDSTALRRAQVRATIQQRKDIFGQNVLIFDSYDELDTTLVQLQDMDAAALRKWATANSIKNDILESNIIYDQEWDNALEKYGLKMHDNVMAASLGTNGLINPFVKPVENRMDSAIAFFLNTMRTKYPQYLSESDTLGKHYIGTLGALDEMALCNSKQLYIVGDEVHRFYGNTEVICPVSDYSNIANMQTAQQVKQYAAASQSSTSPIYVLNMAHVKEIQSNNSSKYVASVQIKVTQANAWFGLERRNAYVYVQNFMLSNGNYMQRYCKTNLDVSMTTSCSNSKSKHVHTFTFDHNCKMKNRTFMHIKYFKRCGFPLTITSYRIKVSNADGAGFEVSK